MTWPAVTPVRVTSMVPLPPASGAPAWEPGNVLPWPKPGAAPPSEAKNSTRNVWLGMLLSVPFTAKPAPAEHRRRQHREVLQQVGSDVGVLWVVRRDPVSGDAEVVAQDLGPL